MVVVGTQENSGNRDEWEVCLQETVGSPHLHAASATHLHTRACSFAYAVRTRQTGALAKGPTAFEQHGPRLHIVKFAWPS